MHTGSINDTAAVQKPHNLRHEHGWKLMESRYLYSACLFPAFASIGISNASNNYD